MLWFYVAERRTPHAKSLRLEKPTMRVTRIHGTAAWISFVATLSVKTTMAIPVCPESQTLATPSSTAHCPPPSGKNIPAVRLNGDRFTSTATDYRRRSDDRVSVNGRKSPKKYVHSRNPERRCNGFPAKGDHMRPVANPREAPPWQPAHEAIAGPERPDFHIMDHATGARLLRNAPGPCRTRTAVTERCCRPIKSASATENRRIPVFDRGRQLGLDRCHGIHSHLVDRVS